MKALRNAFAMSLILLAMGCAKTIKSDGSPEARRVTQWLTQSSWPWNDSANLAPRARLIMSDYEMPLSRSKLRELGPDRLTGCEIASIARSGPEVVATWKCNAPIPLIRRQVWFGVEKDKVGYARYVEVEMSL
jgi:hypothetical protein